MAVNGIRKTISRLILHEKYDKIDNYNDIALLKLSVRLWMF
jgi:hypothetical protein